jgi:hypothetical protein
MHKKHKEKIILLQIILPKISGVAQVQSQHIVPALLQRKNHFALNHFAKAIRIYSQFCG